MAKRLVVCCDGTWNTFGQKHPTNVRKVVDAVKVGTCANGVEQIEPLYVAGVGTHWWNKITGGAVGFGLSKNVKEGYRDIVDAFDPGDEIFLFGFSRGAYTARSIAGFIRNCGILKRENRDRVDEAFALYRGEVKPSDPEAVAFRERYSHESRIRFIGVWDTVGSLGMPDLGESKLANKINKRWEFHDTQLSNYVDSAYQALAIDEKRKPFEPTLWVAKPDRPADQELEQVWFSGVHCNVGGGYASSELSNIPLVWMLKHAKEHDLELNQEIGDAERVGSSSVPTMTALDLITRYLTRTNAFAKLDESRKGFYKLIERVDRTIGKGYPESEFVASSAEQRKDDDESYRPRGLVEYLDNGGQVKGVDYRPGGEEDEHATCAAKW
uniref:DUF2235 domain-containing protein n=1 Tax=Gordonia sp. B7-2 TaxID=3420932 RepID=UPI003D8E49E2